MSWSKEVTIWCDYEDCLRWNRNGSSKVKDAREEAKDYGWTYRAGKDYCPMHS